jgi:hypothetical protein
MAAQTIFELALENDTIPLAKRIEHSMQGRTGKIKTYDHWGSDMDVITDPNTGFTALMVSTACIIFVNISVILRMV